MRRSKNGLPHPEEPASAGVSKDGASRGPAPRPSRRSLAAAPQDEDGTRRRLVSRLLAFALLFLGAALCLRAAYIPAKAALAQALLERAFARAEPGKTPPRPWPWADITPIAAIEFPTLHRQDIVLEGASGQAMAFGPGHMPNTPAIGAPGTAIIAAHRDTQFTRLGALRPGDLIWAVTAGGRRMSFRVTRAEVVRADASGLDPGDGGPTGARLALVTCYPFSGVLHSPWRYVVLADRTGPT
jgi:sortase A